MLKLQIHGLVGRYAYDFPEQCHFYCRTSFNSGHYSAIYVNAVHRCHNRSKASYHNRYYGQQATFTEVCLIVANVLYIRYHST